MSKTIIFETEATGIKRLVLIEVTNSLAQTFSLVYKSAGIEGASSHSGRRTFLTSLANRGTAIHILKTLAGHRSISTTAAYLYSSPSQLKAAVEFV